MRPGDTSMLPGGPQFRSTAWTLIRDAQGASPERAAALDRLVSVYWRPVYWTFRIDWNAGPEEAKDLVQEYFAVFLETGMLDGVAAERGRFRAYVKATVRNFMLSRKRAESAEKRGGGRAIVALQDLERVESGAPTSADSPETRFERELMRSIVAEALALLERECRAEHFALFQRYYLAEARGAEVKYEDLAAAFGLSLHGVKNRLAEMRARFREAVLGFLRDGVSSEEELVAEIREVFG